MMKKLNEILFVGLYKTAIITGLAWSTTVATAFAGQQTIRVDVDGLVCAFCAQGVEKKMKAQAATDKVFVSLDKKVALVSLKEGQDIPDETITSEITNAGYVVKGITRTGESFDALRAKIKASK